MQTTTIKIQMDTKNKLDRLREYKNESYNEVIEKILYAVDNFEKKPHLSKEVLESISKARKRIQSGNFVSEKDAKKRLGL